MGDVRSVSRAVRLLLWGILLLVASGTRADDLDFNGTIIRLDAEGRTFEALGGCDGRIVAGGTKAAVAEKLRPGVCRGRSARADGAAGLLRGARSLSGLGIE